MGLHRAWPDAEIVGMDIKPQPRYPFTFVQADVMEQFDAASAHLCSFDFIWASPPCQRYSHLTPKAYKNGHPDLISDVRRELLRAEVPFAIENVAGARKELRDPVVLCGSMFELKCFRHRFIETSFRIECELKCNHNYRPLLVTTASKASRAIRRPGEYKSVRNGPASYGIDWMNFEGLKEAIPPAYSQYIAEQYMKSQESL